MERFTWLEGQKEEALADRGAATGRRGHQKTHPVSQSVSQEGLGA